MLAAADPAAAAASPTLVTTPNPTKVTLGTAAAPTLTDSAVLAGGSSPTGSILFTLFLNGSATPLFTEAETVDGNGTYLASFMLPAQGADAGTYQWDATYSGDASNSAASDTGNPNERVVVTEASPSITTKPNPAKVTLGTAAAPTLTDSAVLAGGFSPTGTLLFTVFFNGSTTPLFTDVETVDGNGTYLASVMLPTQGAIAGTYQWDTSYAGDANNAAASDTSNPDERVVVSKTSPSITTKSGKSVVIGSALSDSATLSNGAGPTGTMTFTLYNPGGRVVYTDHVSVSGNGIYTTAAGDHPGGFISAVAGNYQWVAAYSGDNINKALSTTKGAEPERVVYGFGGFSSPRPKATLKSSSTISVKFRFTNSAGRAITGALAAKLAAGHSVTATLSGPGIKRHTVSCTWNGVRHLFQCNIKTPRGVRTGPAHRYLITVFERIAGSPVRAPAIPRATTSNPETVFFN